VSAQHTVRTYCSPSAIHMPAAFELPFGSGSSFRYLPAICRRELSRGARVRDCRPAWEPPNEGELSGFHSYFIASLAYGRKLTIRCKQAYNS
jgi:hypothetical protein